MFQIRTLSLFTLLVIVLSLPSVTFADSDSTMQTKLNLGYFIGTASDWSDVYDGGGTQVGLAFKYKMVDWLRLAVDASYMMASGEAVSTNDFPYANPPESDFTLIDGFLGVEYLHNLSSMSLFFGVGADYLMWEEEMKSDDLTETYDGSTIGYGAYLGLDYYLDSLFLSTELRYKMASFDTDDSAVAFLGDSRDFAGATFYLGVGYSF